MKILMAAMGLDIGGAETHIVELARALACRGHEVIVASNGGAYVPELEAAGVRHILAPMHRRSPVLMLRSLGILRRVIRAERPQVVHAHARIPAFLCGILKKSMGFTLVTTAHWVFSAAGALRSLTNWGDRTLAVSPDIKKYLTNSFGVPEDRIDLTINGIDTLKFSPEVSGFPVRRELGIPDGAQVIVHVSRLDASRADAAFALVDIAPQIEKRVPGAVILIAGGGSEFERLSEKADAANRALGRECVILTGPRTDINNICAAGSVFVGVSRAALEAMASGIPAVIAGNEGYMGLFDSSGLETGIEGNFCCRGCPGLTAEALLEDVTRALTLTDVERRTLCAFGRRVVLEHYGVDRMAEDALRTYDAARGVRHVLLSGYYGYGNAGDDAIMEALVRQVRQISPGARIAILMKCSGQDREGRGVTAVPRFSPLRVLDAVKNCDLLISGGGSLLQDSTSTRSLLYYLSIIRLAQRRGKLTALCANGIGPVRHSRNRELVRRAVESVDAVSLRDPGSLGELRSMGVERGDIYVTSDPVFTLPKPDPALAERILRENRVTGDYIAVSVRPFNAPRAYFDALARLCDGAARRFGAGILFVDMQPRRDAAVSRAVRARMAEPSAVLSGEYTPEEIMGVIGGARAVLSMRLHALIFAARMAVPALGFVYDPKVQSFLSLLGQPSAGDGTAIDPAAALEELDGLLSDRDATVARLSALRDRLCDAAGKDDVILRELLA